MTHTYKGIYKDDEGSSPIEIKNDFEHLSFSLGQFEFEGVTIDDFELLNYDNYSKEALTRFSFNKIPSSDGFVYEICNYALTVFIPIELINPETGETFSKDLKIFSNSAIASRSLIGMNSY